MDYIDLSVRTISKNAYLWIYYSRTNKITKYSNAEIRYVGNVGSNIECADAFFEDKRNTVSAHEFDPWLHAGYYRVWSETNDDKKARLAISKAVVEDVDEKISDLKKQMDRYFEIRENALDLVDNDSNLGHRDLTY